MKPDLVSTLFQEARQVTYSKGQTVISYGAMNCLFYLKEGYIKRYTIDKKGELSVQAIYGPGYMFPLTPVFFHLYDILLSQTADEYFYGTMSDVVLLKKNLDSRSFKNLSNQTYNALLFETGIRLQSNIQQLENLALKDTRSRIAHQLSYLARCFGKRQTDGSIKILIPMTQQDMADYLSLSRETVARQYSSLRGKGFIRTNKGLHINDLGKLESLYM